MKVSHFSGIIFIGLALLTSIGWAQEQTELQPEASPQEDFEPRILNRSPAVIAPAIVAEETAWSDESAPSDGLASQLRVEP